jgi:hypothetical protein
MIDQSGKSKLGCIIYIVLFGLALTILLTVAPAFVEKFALEDEIAEVVNKAGAHNWNDNTIRNEIMDICNNRGFDVTRREISVSRDPRSRPVRKIRVSVTYQKTFRFATYSYPVTFNLKREGLIGRL